MSNYKFRLLFEQSGTFKNVLRSFGFPAYDYDILNDFNQTDFRLDLFKEINAAFVGYKSIFDEFANDTVIAFFPCIRFSKQFLLCWRMEAHQYSGLSAVEKFQKSITFMEELQRLYTLLNQLCILSFRKGFKLIIENPSHSQSFLNQRWFLKPSVVINDRSKFGDYYVKPTQFFFVNCSAYDNPLFESQPYCKRDKDVVAYSTVERSLIGPYFASWFLRSFVLSPSELDNLPSSAFGVYHG